MKTSDFLKLIDNYYELEYNKLCDLRLQKHLYSNSYPNMYTNQVELNYHKIMVALDGLKLYIDKKLKYTTKKFLFIQSKTKYKDFSLYELEQSELVSKNSIEIAKQLLK